MVQTYPTTNTGAGGDTVKTGIVQNQERTDTLLSNWYGVTAPLDTLSVIGQLWVDSSTSPPTLKTLESKSPSEVWKIVPTQGDGQVNAASLTADAVETAKIKDLNVTTGKVALLAITEALLGAESVETGKIKDLNVTTGKVALLAITSAQLSASAATAAKIATSAVETDKLNNASVTEAKLGTASVTNTKLGTDAVTSAKIADQNVPVAKLQATGSVPFVFGKRTADATPVEIPLAEVQGRGGRFISALPNKISKGANAMAVLTSEDEIWTIGSVTHASPLNASGKTANTNWEPVIFDAARGTITKFYVSSHSGFAIDSNGDVWAWGGNANGQLGVGDLVRRNVATQVTALSGVNISEIVVADCGNGAQDSTFFITDTGAVWCCGYNAYGQLGLGDLIQEPTATLNTSLTSVSQLSYSNSGRGHCISRDTSGAVKTWGYNGHGQLGDGTTINVTTPTTIAALTSVDFVKALAIENSTGGHTFAADGSSVDAAGYNLYGQLGDTSTTQQTSFVSSTIGGSPNNIVDIQGNGGYGSSILLDSDGDLFSTGYNAYGQLGLGDTVNRSSFEAVTMPSTTATKLLTYNGYNGGTASMFLGADGELYGTGYNLYDGALGQGNLTNLSSFTKVIRLGSETITDFVAAGGNPAFGVYTALRSAVYAIDANGNLYAVGKLGDLGIGLIGGETNLQWHMVPVPVV